MEAMARVIRGLRVITRENSMPAVTAAPMTALFPNAESPRAMILPCAPQARAVVIAERSWDAAPRPEPVLPPRSRISVIAGAACAVDRVVTSGDRPLRSRARPAIFACP